MNKKVLVFALLALTLVLTGCDNRIQQNNSNLQTNSSSTTEIVKADGKITFRSINGELAENQAIVTKYQARSSSLFVNAIREGRDNIEEDTMVWRLVGDEQKFKNYFKGKIENIIN